ncbi:hypothetical protein SKAU_G00073870 [Synaphobranchus kaupii]|uniref:Uncharacterized protein n=1 Tax=Synaphobranchus kaupii TaxID=118154 RepID=A0A9Q1G7A9_SYNKA|nr:hypothetical protein SKAU_G00073870 [Synaphobranchus kaupii]
MDEGGVSGNVKSEAQRDVRATPHRKRRGEKNTVRTKEAAEEGDTGIRSERNGFPESAGRRVLFTCFRSHGKWAAEQRAPVLALSQPRASLGSRATRCDASRPTGPESPPVAADPVSERPPARHGNPDGSIKQKVPRRANGEFPD